MATEIQLPLDQMTVAEKLEVIDTVWNDLLEKNSEIPVPEWHIKILEEREKALASGETKFIDFEEAVADIWKQVETLKKINEN